MFLGEASYRPRTGLVQASYRPRTGAFYRRLEKRRRLRRLFSPWRLKVSTALVPTYILWKKNFSHILFFLRLTVTLSFDDLSTVVR